MFNFKTFIHLIKLSLYLNRKLILWLMISFGLLFLFAPLFSIPLFVGGALISSAAFREVHDPEMSIQYLSLPTSSLTRYLSVWALTGPLYLILISGLYGVSILAHLFAGTFWGFPTPRDLLWTAGEYLIVNAIFLLGSIHFKKLPLLKTLLGLLLVGLALVNLPELRNIAWIAFGLVAWWGAYHQLQKSELR